jgi:hypothetical protein
MFAFISTNNATHIAINIPKEGADKTIPALVGMLERNAVFIHKGYGTLETRTPQMSIQLGDKIALDNSDLELIVLAPSNREVLDESFVHESPEVKISNRKAIETKDAEIQRLRTELAHVKQQLSDLKDAIAATEQEDA